MNSLMQMIAWCKMFLAQHIFLFFSSDSDYIYSSACILIKRSGFIWLLLLS